MKDFLRKLSSRKLWLAIAGVVSGIAIALGADTSDIQTVTGAVTALVSAVTYIVTEGKIDASAVESTIELIPEAIEVIETEDEETE